MVNEKLKTTVRYQRYGLHREQCKLPYNAEVYERIDLYFHSPLCVNGVVLS